MIDLIHPEVPRTRLALEPYINEKYKGKPLTIQTLAAIKEEVSNHLMREGWIVDAVHIHDVYGRLEVSADVS